MKLISDSTVTNSYARLALKLVTFLGTGGATCFHHAACTADVILIQRESSAEVAGFAGAGGAGQSYANDLSTTALSGSFSFADSFSLAVTESMQFSTGAATSTGSLSVFDSLSQPSSNSLLFIGSRTASSSVARVSGNGVATASLNQEMRVRFQVTGNPVDYELTGFYDPGATFGRIGEASLVQLNRPFTAFSAFSFSSMGPVNLNGTLNPGFIYEFRLRLNDSMGAGSGNPLSSDSSSFHLQFKIGSVPEPSSALLAGLPGVLVLGRRRKRRAQMR